MFKLDEGGVTIYSTMFIVGYRFILCLWVLPVCTGGRGGCQICPSFKPGSAGGNDIYGI